MKNQIGKSKAVSKTTTKAKSPKATEFTVKIRMKPDRLEWFSAVSDQLGLTRDQAVSGMLESNMEADSTGIRLEESQAFIVRAASALFPERKALKSLEAAFDAQDAAEQAIEKARGTALIDLHAVAPKEMGIPALHQTKGAMLRVLAIKGKLRSPSPGR